MKTLYDLVQESFADAARTRAFGDAFGLRPDQTLEVVTALLPAYSLALKRVANDPGAFLSLIGLMGPLSAQSMPVAANTDILQSAQKGLAILFGRPEAQSAIADMVARTSGVPADKVVEMMPATLADVMTAIQKTMPFSDGPGGDLIAAFVDGYQRGRPEPRAQPDFSVEAAADLMTSFMSGFQRGRDEDDADNGQTDTPAPDDQNPAAPDDQNPPAPDDADSSDEDGASMRPESALDTWLSVGDRIQKSHMQSMADLFEKLYSRPDRTDKSDPHAT